MTLLDSGLPLFVYFFFIYTSSCRYTKKYVARAMFVLNGVSLSTTTFFFRKRKFHLINQEITTPAAVCLSLTHNVVWSATEATAGFFLLILFPNWIPSQPKWCVCVWCGGGKPTAILAADDAENGANTMTSRQKGRFSFFW